MALRRPTEVGVRGGHAQRSGQVVGRHVAKQRAWAGQEAALGIKALGEQGAGGDDAAPVPPMPSLLYLARNRSAALRPSTDARLFGAGESSGRDSRSDMPKLTSGDDWIGVPYSAIAPLRGTVNWQNGTLASGKWYYPNN